MNEQQFKAAYIAQFLASYMASRYDQDCQLGHLGAPYDNQPVEDAFFLAECAWTQVLAHAEANKAGLFNR